MLPTSLPLILISSLAALSASAALTVPSIFADDMVLQRDRALPVWGWTDPGQAVTVQFGTAQATATSAADGRWEVALPAQAASRQGASLKISNASGETRTFKNVLVGDVWILGGQSNIGWSVKQSAEATEAAARANYPWLRYFTQHPIEGACDTPAQDVKGGRWHACRPGSVDHFSAVGFFFAEALHTALGDGVPIALVQTAMGGTAIESWIAQAPLESIPAGQVGAKFFRDAVATFEAKKTAWLAAKAAYAQQAAAAKAAGLPEPEMDPALKKEPAGLSRPMLPSALFNGKVAPLQPFAVRGVLWYQGEANASDTASAKRYGDLLPLLITTWRAGWQDPALPFIVIQLPGYGAGSSKWADWPTLRAQQAATVARTPGSALVCTIDLGEKDNIHPARKQPVGERAALVARRHVYGDKTAISEGPRFLKAERAGAKILLRFSHTGALLTTNAAAPVGLEIAGANGKFSPIEPKLAGDALIVTPPGNLIPPLSLRYAWANWPAATISDASGLPLAPFQTQISR